MTHACAAGVDVGRDYLDVGVEPSGLMFRTGNGASGIEVLVRRLKREGVKFETEPTNQDWLWREASLRDPAGNQLILYAAGENRLNPPWRLP